MSLPDRTSILRLIRSWLAEDIGTGDATSISVIPKDLQIEAAIIARKPGILAGVDAAREVFRTHDRSLRVTRELSDGKKLKSGEVILRIHGRARKIFEAERTALNLLGHLCGVATLAHAFAQRVVGTHARILDTRKTLPGLRVLEKYAVTCGGGMNHRMRLDDAILIKTNHLRALGGGRVDKAILAAKQSSNRLVVEAEVATWAEFERALSVHPDTILLDNWTLPAIRKAVDARNRQGSVVSGVRRPELEVSGGVTLANLRRIAQTGVERISVGRLTHSAPSLDVSLRVL